VQTTPCPCAVVVHCPCGFRLKATCGLGLSLHSFGMPGGGTGAGSSSVIPSSPNTYRLVTSSLASIHRIAAFALTILPGSGQTSILPFWTLTSTSPGLGEHHDVAASSCFVWSCFIGAHDAKVANARHNNIVDRLIGLLPVEKRPLQPITDHRPRRSDCELTASNPVSGSAHPAGLYGRSPRVAARPAPIATPETTATRS